MSDKIAFWAAVFTALQFAGIFATVRVMQGVARRQLRAQVGVEMVELETQPLQGKANIAIKVGNSEIWTNFLAVTVKNFGSTLAKDVTFVGYVTTLPFGHALSDDFNFYHFNDWNTAFSAGNFVSKFTLAPGQSEITKAPITDISMVDSIHGARRAEVSVYVWGRIYYRDIYGRSWRTKFCKAWEPWHPHGARYVPYSEHNGEDNASLDQQKPWE